MRHGRLFRDKVLAEAAALAAATEGRLPRQRDGLQLDETSESQLSAQCTGCKHGAENKETD
jgi:hypothetical protein